MASVEARAASGTQADQHHGDVIIIAVGLMVGSFSKASSSALVAIAIREGSV
jgi:hypothetical protein